MRMLTGDHIFTAIAEEVRILPAVHLVSSVLTAEEFDMMTDAKIDCLEQLPLARCSPQKKCPHYRCYTSTISAEGDDRGWNQYYSINQVGIAMGLGGSDVARQAAEMVSTEDHFATVVTAITDGGRIF